MSHRALRDGSSRYNTGNVSVNRRQSHGGVVNGKDGLENNSQTTPQKNRKTLLDSSAFRQGTLSSSSTRAMSAPRRQSFGGDALGPEAQTRDRRAMLEAWRQARAGNRSGDDDDTRKRARNEPPLPPTSTCTPVHTKVQRTATGICNISGSQTPSQTSYIQCYDEDSDYQNRTGTLLTSRTPVGRRGLLGSARRNSLVGRNVGPPIGKQEHPEVNA